MKPIYATTILTPAARAVALSLADEDLRKRVHAALGESRVPENKLHFSTLLATNELGLVDGAAMRVGVSNNEFLATVGGVLDLEVYMPVDEHREAWMGGAELLVASVLDDDGSTPFAFNLNGEPVAVDPEIAPNMPVLALVPVETDYWAVEANHSDLILARDMSSDPGVYMTFSEIGDDFEGWLHGDPEFEIHTFKRIDGEWVDIECAGEDRSAPYWFNQDDQYAWDGEVLLIADEDLEGDSVLFQYWENDSDACGDLGNAGRPPSAEDDISDLLDSIQVPAISGPLSHPNPPLIYRIFKAAWDVIDLDSSLFTDDFVGIIEWPPVTCWPEESGPIYADIMLNGSKEGYAKLDDTFEGRSPLCDIDASISGPSTITWCQYWLEPDPTAYFSASVSGGSGTPSYQWWFDGDLVSTSSWYEIPNEDLTAGDHQLEVLVTRGGEQATAWKAPTVVIDCSGN